jgi:hypothetical protein
MSQPQPAVNWTKKDHTTLLELWFAGKSEGEMESALGKSRSAIASKVHRFGLPARRKGNGLQDLDPSASIRPCMRCSEEFFSQWKGNRMCVHCAGASATML